MSHVFMQSLVGRFTDQAQRMGRGLGADTFWMVSVAVVLAGMVVLAQLMLDTAA